MTTHRTDPSYLGAAGTEGPHTPLANTKPAEGTGANVQARPWPAYAPCGSAWHVAPDTSTFSGRDSAATERNGASGLYPPGEGSEGAVGADKAGTSLNGPGGWVDTMFGEGDARSFGATIGTSDVLYRGEGMSPESIVGLTFPDGPVGPGSVGVDEKGSTWILDREGKAWWQQKKADPTHDDRGVPFVDLEPLPHSDNLEDRTPEEQAAIYARVEAKGRPNTMEIADMLSALSDMSSDAARIWEDHASEATLMRAHGLLDRLALFCAKAERERDEALRRVHALETAPPAGPVELAELFQIADRYAERLEGANHSLPPAHRMAEVIRQLKAAALDQFRAAEEAATERNAAVVDRDHARERSRIDRLDVMQAEQKSDQLGDLFRFVALDRTDLTVNASAEYPSVSLTYATPHAAMMAGMAIVEAAISPPAK